MSFKTLQRAALLLMLGFFLAMAWLGVHDSRRMDELLGHFVDRHIEAASLLHETENSLIQARRVYANLVNDRSGSVDDCLGMLDMIALRLKQQTSGTDTLASGIALDLARIRSGLTQIEEMRSKGDYSDAMAKTVKAVEQYLGSARAAAGQLAGSTMHPGEVVYFLNNSLDSFGKAATLYLQANPDQLPVLLGLMDKLASNTKTLLAYSDMEAQREPLLALGKQVKAIRSNVSQVRAHLLWDPNFFANTNKAEVRELNDLWDASMQSVQSTKESESVDVHADAAGIRQALEMRRRQFLLAASAALALAVLGAFVLRAKLMARIMDLKRGTGLIAGGNLEYRIPEGGDDLFGELSAQFNAMAQRLQEERARTSQALDELNRANETLGRRFREESQALGEALKSLDIKDCVIDRSHEGVVICDQSLRIVDANPAMSQLTGYPPERLIGLTPDAFCPGSAAGDFRLKLHSGLETSGSYEAQLDILTRGGDSVHVRVFFVGQRDGGERPSHVIGIFRNMTPQSLAMEQLRLQARQDRLTGLPNRSALLSELSAYIVRAERADRMLAVFLLNLDNFKRLIESQGHEEGDALLRQVAKRLESRVRSGDLVARAGGDEFAVVTDRITSEAQARALAARLLDCFSLPFDLPGGSYRINASLGLTIHPRDGGDPDTLLRNAAVALHQAKDSGRGKLRIFTEELDARVRARSDLERDVLAAVANREFEVHYQPIVGMDAREITGAEALLRWRRKGDFLSPAVFIPVCEELNIMPEITAIILDRIARDTASWNTQGLSPHVSVNICAAHFSEPEFHSFLDRELTSRGLENSRIGVEITETTIMKDPEAARDTIRILRQRGHQVSIDDFGTGYSSLRYLQQLPFTTLKIDRQFIVDLDSRQGRAIVKATVAMAKSLGLTVVAEGVETPAQLEYLRGCGCDHFQGYLYSPAVTANAFASLFKRPGAAQSQAGNALPVQENSVPGGDNIH